MELEALAELIKKINQRKAEIATKKNKDYSYRTDVHSNFHTVAAICKLLGIDVSTPQGCIQYLVIHKIHRLFKLINSGADPENESLLDNAIDTEVYLDLLIGSLGKRHEHSINNPLDDAHS